MDGATFTSPNAPAEHIMAEQPKRLNRRQAAKLRTRQRVLDAGRRLFREVGYEAATIRRIVAIAGMSTGALFANFTDKRDLYVAAFGHPPLTPEQGLDLVDALRAAEAFVRGFEDDPLQEGVADLLATMRAALPAGPAEAVPPTGGADA